MKKNKIVKRGVLSAIAVLAAVVCTIIICYLTVSINAGGRTYDSITDIPHNRYGLLLGTSPITPEGVPNYYFDNRIKAAAELYKAGKISVIIASGGDYRNDHQFGCDEPEAMRDSLAAQGVPTDSIILDYEGRRTINSIAKAKSVYGLDSVTLISQKYHNERAIYQADKYDLYAIGYNAEPSPKLKNRIKNTVREYFARPKMFLDFLFSAQ